MGLELDVDIDSFRKKLIGDGKKSIVIKSVMENRKRELVQNEIINYMSVDEIKKIILNEDDLMGFVSNYSINTNFIDMVYELVPTKNACLKPIIEKHAKHLRIRHFKRLLKEKALKDFLVENSVNLQDEEFYYLYSEKIITCAHAEKIEYILRKPLERKDFRDMSKREMMSVAHMRTLSSDELQFALNIVMNSSFELERKGMIENLIQTQIIPEDVLSKIVKTWEYDTSETWFKKMLLKQNLDNILEYILDKHSLDASQMELIFCNNRTSRKLISSLYEKNTSVALKSKNPRVPVLDCHIQSL